MGQGQYLQYAKILPIVRNVWPSFPIDPQKSSTLTVLHNYVGGKRLVSHLYRALREDRPAPLLSVQEKWEALVHDSITKLEWSRVHEGVKTVSTNARFKLTQYNYVH